jgi:acyl-CoA synthetase (AMP-forming)/AMP-acid ligase II
MATEPTCNIAAFLPELAAQRPEQTAIHCPRGRGRDGRQRYDSYTLAELDARSDRIARALQSYGIGRGVRTVLMVRPSFAFFALTFGMFKAGVVPVMIDPGIGLKQLKTCIADAEPEAFIGIGRAHFARLLFGWGRSTIDRLVTVGRRWCWGGSTLAGLESAVPDNVNWTMATTRPEETAAILFTSGSTGVPKGVVYEHRHFVGQVEMIRATYGIEPGEVDLPTFPLFALFDPALGMTTVVPDMDFTRPASVDPRDIIEPIQEFSVTNMFGSPALLDTVGRWGAEREIHLPSVRRVISAGAPVPATVLRQIDGMLEPQAQVFTPYGATECLPVCSIGSDEVLAETGARTAQGAGVCVGRPVDPNEVEVIAIEDEPILSWSEATPLEPGKIGEIVVKGPTVTASYHGRDRSTVLAKIIDGAGLRHRMGDLGYFDAQGRLWFCGRKSHRLQTVSGTMFTVPCEAVFNSVAGVYRSALVGIGAVGHQRPVLCIELERGIERAEREALERELQARAEEYDHTRSIQTFLFHPGFPVDIRHNAKINRPELARWATGELAVED